VSLPSERELIVECKPDQLLLEIFGGYRRSEINHKEDRGRAIKYIRKRGVRGLCVVDEDPSSGYPVNRILKDFREVTGDEERKLRVRRFVKDDKVVLVLQPNLEGWVLRAARLCGVKPEKFNLPNEESALHSVINNNLKNFKRFLSELSGCNNLITLKNMLKGGSD